MKKQLWVDLLSGLLLLVYAYTSTAKLLERRKFAFQMTLSPFHILRPLSAFLSVSVPIAELIIVALLAFEKTKKMGLYGSVVLLTVFTIYIFALLISGVHLPCTCGGIMTSLSWRNHLIVNMVLLTGNWVAIYLYNKRGSTVRFGLAGQA